MLIRFQVANYRSIKEAMELTMVAVDNERPQARLESMLGHHLLPLAGVFGPNASGKSNLLSAMAWLLEAVSSSLQTWHHFIPVDQFASGSGEGSPTTFELELTIHGVRFEYLLEVTPFSVTYEALFHYPHKKRRRLFEREADGNVSTQRGLKNLAGAKQLLTGQTLFLATAHRSEEPTISSFVSELSKFQAWGPIPVRPWPLASGATYSSSKKSLRALDLFDHPRPEALVNLARGFPDSVEDLSQQALGLLRLADLGITAVAAYPQQIRSPNGEVVREASVIRFQHQIGDWRTDLPLNEESKGTLAWVDLIGPTIQALQTGSVLLVDEFDASLHPKLSAELLHIFANPGTNPRNAQLIFTAHDTSLLAHLNRDEVWLCEKRLDGSTRLGALSDFKGGRVRRSQNLESGYLGGRFGALPQINQLEYLRSLGLIG